MRDDNIQQAFQCSRIKKLTPWSTDELIGSRFRKLGSNISWHISLAFDFDFDFIRVDSRQARMGHSEPSATF